MTGVLQLLKFVWAGPNSLLGLCVGAIGVLFGGSVRRRGMTLEFYGGATHWFVTHLPGGQFTLALTLGHTILGQTDASLDIARNHELVHVAQYERWGPFFLPAYFASSIYLWMIGRDPYRDNPFEREAYALDP